MVVTRDGPNGKEVLLIKRAAGAAEGGKWALPGGFHDTEALKGEEWRPGKETAKEAALRELLEESNLDASAVSDKLEHIGLYDKEGRDPRDNDEAWAVSNAFKVHLEGDLANQNIMGMDDAADAKWFPAAALPDDIAFDHSDILSDSDVATVEYDLTNTHLDLERNAAGVVIDNHAGWEGLAARDDIKGSKAKITAMREAVDVFTTSGYTEMRKAQRTGQARYLKPAGRLMADEVRNRKEIVRHANAVESFIDGETFNPTEEVFRGVGSMNLDIGSSPSPDFIMAKFKGQTIDMGGTSSWSSELDVAEEFAMSEASSYRPLVFRTRNIPGSKSVTGFGGMAFEHEVVVSNRARFRVTGASWGDSPDAEAEYIIVDLEPVRAKAKRTKKKKSRSKVGERSRANPYLTRKGGGERGRESFETHKLERWITIG
ncbi:MAG: NUDIX hydrolase, partial [bacterium]|nr:NUDIX hydrolase [bacterium]